MTDIYYYVTALFGEGQTYRKKRYGVPPGLIFWQKRGILGLWGACQAFGDLVATFGRALFVPVEHMAVEHIKDIHFACW
jgi:hypothetical protein